VLVLVFVSVVWFITGSKERENMKGEKKVLLSLREFVMMLVGLSISTISNVLFIITIAREL
jgi:hypothetical protein